MAYILVTGSEGLIGNKLCIALEKMGRLVRHFDIRYPKPHESYGNILDTACLQEKVKDCSGIIHLAAVSRVVWGERDPDLCWQTNVVGTKNIIKVAMESSLKPWIIYASSREVYGQQRQLPVEIDAGYQPMNIYARSKVEAEKEILQARYSYLNTAVVRYSSVYGSVGDHADRVTPAFCRAATFGTPFKIEGKDNTLDFTHVEDVVDGTIKLINLLEHKELLPPIHLTTGVPTTLYQLAVLASKAAGKELKLKEMPCRSYDVTRFWGNTHKTSQLLNWQAKIPVATGIYNLVQQFLEGK